MKNKLINKIILITPYWVAHALAAVAISLPFIVLWESIPAFFMGSMYYLGREIRDVEKLHDWDWEYFDYPGLFGPIIANALVFAGFELYHYFVG